MKSHVSPMWFSSTQSDQIAGNFYTSARKLCESLGLKPPKLGKGAFPENIVKDFERMDAQMQRMNKPLGLFIADDPAFYGCLGYYHRMEIEPVFLPLEKLGICSVMPGEELLAAVIGGAFAYLRLAGLLLPYENEFMDTVYNDLLQYIYDREEGDDQEVQERIEYFENELYKSREDGWKAEEYLARPSLLEGWGAALQAYQPVGGSRRKIKRICQRLYRIFLAFPGRQIGDASFPELVDGNVECIPIHQMLGFQFGGQSIVMDELENWVHICWDSNPDTIMPMGYHLFGPERTKVVSIRFQQHVYTACERLHKALCSLQL